MKHSTTEEPAILLAENTRFYPAPAAAYSRLETDSVWRFHHSLPDYSPTPLCDQAAWARRLGVRSVLVKDESARFGLKAFKGLGGIYAMARMIGANLGLAPDDLTMDRLLDPSHGALIRSMEFVTTTDGNHGKGVSWAAKRFRCKSHVFMPAGSAEVRAQAIRDAGNAEVQITEFCYDDCVAYTAELAQTQGWQLIQDTAWPGYEQVPAWIMQGYTTMVWEALDQMRVLGVTRPTHVFLQAGVGSVAAAVAGALSCAYPDALPVISIVEPHGAACIYESVRQGDGAPQRATGSGRTIMAGLNCGEPCSIAWDMLRDLARFSFSCDDSVAEHGMRLLAHPQAGDRPIVSGESGAVTAGLLDLLMTEPAYRPMADALGLDRNAVVLLISTEGDTDPEHYHQVVSKR